jgi:hypothetical protein
MHLWASSNCRPCGSAFGACCCAGKLRSPTPPTRRTTSPGPAQRASKGTPNPTLDPTPNPTLDPTHARCVPSRLPAGGITTGKSPCGGPVARKNCGRLAPLGGVVLARLIHSSAGRLEGAAFGGEGAAFGGDRFMQPTGRRMERSQSLRTYRCAAIFDGDPISTVPRSSTNGTSPAVAGDRPKFACPARDDPPVTRPAHFAVTNRSAHQAATIRLSLATRVHVTLRWSHRHWPAVTICT